MKARKCSIIDTELNVTETFNSFGEAGRYIKVAYMLDKPSQTIISSIRQAYNTGSMKFYKKFKLLVLE